MFGLGFWEIALVVLALIVFVKPADLPRLFFKIGRVYGELQAMTRSMRQMMRTIEEEGEAGAGRTDRPRGAEASDVSAEPRAADANEKE